MHQPVFTVHLGPLDCVFVNEYMHTCILVKCIYLFFIVETILADVRGMQTAQQLRLLSDSTIKNKNTCSHTHTRLHTRLN